MRSSAGSAAVLVLGSQPCRSPLDLCVTEVCEPGAGARVADYAVGVPLGVAVADEDEDEFSGEHAGLDALAVRACL
ncbi:hypothetical protein GCM10010252_26670 [Streptomyces aureoverticillatus]|nr:hypothetical protein GCM10010252_26670 [Streptomyces aureoverticillatus]